MPSSRSAGGGGGPYNLVQSDDLDTRVPLLPEEAFQQGINFNCKFIGSMDIPRPTSRVEIVAAMRRVRFEFKQKGMKKKKVTLTVSTNGIKTVLRKKRSKKKVLSRGRKDYSDVDCGVVLELHPIYRIFYVSHDSQDVKIFSYIAREPATNLFHCCVFKATKKAQAMRIVRTVGQAFEVCHKLVASPDEETLPPTPEKKSAPALENGLKKSSHHALVDTQAHLKGAAHKAQKLFSKLSRRTSENPGASTTGSPTTELPPVKQPDSTGPPTATANKPPTPDEEKKPPQQPSSSNENPSGVKCLDQSTNQKRERPADLNLEGSREEEVEVDLVNLSTPGTPTKGGPVGVLKKDSSHSHSPSLPPPSPVRKLFTFPSAAEIPIDPQGVGGGSAHGSMGALHEAHLLREKLDQQGQQTQAALAQINLLRDQLAAESAARIEAQGRTHQLLLHNKELLDHLQSLVRHIHELESRLAAVDHAHQPHPPTPNNSHSHTSTLNNSPTPALPQAGGSSGFLHPPISFQEIEALRRQNAALLESMLYEQNARSLFSSYPTAAAATAQPPPQVSPAHPSRLFQPPYYYAGNPLGSPAPALPSAAASSLIVGNPLHQPVTKPPTGGGYGLTPPKLGVIGRNPSAEEADDTLHELKSRFGGTGLGQGQGLGQGLGRSVSEKAGHKSELMSQVQRSQWARHTTK